MPFGEPPAAGPRGIGARARTTVRRVARIKDARGGGLVLRAHALAVLAPARAQLARERLVARQVCARGLRTPPCGLSTADACRCAQGSGKSNPIPAHVCPALPVTASPRTGRAPA
jgi:hypothetical protein